MVSSAPGHREAVHTITVGAGAQNLAFTLPAPSPLYGSINVSSTPDGATIKLDGQPVGETPLLLNNVLVGKHTVQLELAGKGTYSGSVDVREGEISDLNEELKARPYSTPSENNNLPAIVLHPLGYNGPWDFFDKEKTQNALIKYFMGLDKSFYLDRNWLFTESSHKAAMNRCDLQFHSMRYKGSFYENRISINYNINKNDSQRIITYLATFDPDNMPTGANTYYKFHVAEGIDIIIRKSDSKRDKSDELSVVYQFK